MTGIGGKNGRVASISRCDDGADMTWPRQQLGIITVTREDGSAETVITDWEPLRRVMIALVASDYKFTNEDGLIGRPRVAVSPIPDGRRLRVPLGEEMQGFVEVLLTQEEANRLASLLTEGEAK